MINRNMEEMKLRDLYNIIPEAKYAILNFSNNSVVTINKADVEDDNSSFVRRSKRRLDETFNFYGIIQGDKIIYGTSGKFKETDYDGLVYRTFYPKCAKHNYFLFVMTGDCQYINEVMRKGYRRINKEFNAYMEKLEEESVKEWREMNEDMNNLPETCFSANGVPIIDINAEDEIKPNRKVDLYVTHGVINGNQVWQYKLVSPQFTHEFKSKCYPYNGREYVGQYMATTNGLNKILTNADKFNKVRIHADWSKRYADGIYKLPLGKWKPFNDECRAYVNTMLYLKNSLAKKGVAVCFAR